MDSSDADTIELIPIERITVINPRVRNKKIFKEIVANIAELGLKRPITVTRRDDPDGPRYALVCGQGRLEAYQALGQHEIPAIVVKADTEDCMVMSLVENLARRQHRAIDLLHDIEGLKQRGYNDTAIARKTGLTIEYVKGVLRLLHNGEHRLLRAVEAGQIPVSIAVDIAGASDTETQAILQQAYEKKLLRGHKLIAARRLIEQRQRRGKGRKINGSQNGKRRERPLSSNALIRAYQEDVDRKRILIRKAETTRNRLIFVTEAIRKLIVDENFVTLLRAEGLETLPETLPHALRPERRPDMARGAATSIVKVAFEDAKVRIAIAQIQPLKLVSAAIKKTPKYAQIAASIREVGLVEPPVVARDHSDSGKYLLLDGHSRIDVLKDMGHTDVICLVSTDDEAFTYNKRVNRLAMI